MTYILAEGYHMLPEKLNPLAHRLETDTPMGTSSKTVGEVLAVPLQASADTSLMPNLTSCLEHLKLTAYLA
jgi:hypothetical protein